MTGLLICAAVVGRAGVLSARRHEFRQARALIALGLALIAVALWLAYAAGAQP